MGGHARRFVSGLDAYQRRHRRLGFPIAVVYKFGDDRGSYLTALITYYGFLSLFPLLLLLTTVLGFVLQDDPALQARLVDSTLAELPIIGAQLRENVGALTGSGVAFAIGVVGTIYGCLGVAGALQNAFSRVWAIPRNERPNPIKSRLRSLLLLLVLGAGVLVTTAVSALTTGNGAFGATVGAALQFAAIPLATLVNVGLFLLAFRVLTTDHVQLTGADERAYTAYAESERHKGFQHVDVEFDDPDLDDTPAPTREPT